jgi:hypothetical protein
MSLVTSISDNFCGVLEIYTVYVTCATKKGNKHTGKDESDPFLYGK